MSANLFYLMTMLPALPPLGETADYSGAITKIRDEDSGSLSYLADLLETENLIEQCGLEYYALENKDYTLTIPTCLPDSFSDIFYSFKDMAEADWLTKVYQAWFNLLIETGNKCGSKLLSRWAKWEYSLRVNLLSERLNKSANNDSESYEMVSATENFVETNKTSALVVGYKTITEPFEAEKYLDQSRIDYLRNESIQFSFSIDELVAYILEMRIHNRYSRLRPELGSKILEEVTKL